MGFATPFLSLTRLSLKVFPTTLPANFAAASTQGKPTQTQPPIDEFSGFNAAYPNVFTMRKSRHRRSSNTQRTKSKSTVSVAQLDLPLYEDTPIAVQAQSQQAQPILKIVQREPRKQPECMLISGRMADVCAALERMAHNEHVRHG